MNNENKWQEEFEKYFYSLYTHDGSRHSEAVFKYAHGNFNYDKQKNAYLAACKKQQEEIDRARNAVKNEGFLRDHYVNECVKLRAEVEKLKVKNKQLRVEESIIREARILMISQDEENIKAYEQEINRLKDLVKRAKPFIFEKYLHSQGRDSLTGSRFSANIETEQWLKDGEVIGEGRISKNNYSRICGISKPKKETRRAKQNHARSFGVLC